jgi:hypothetical protein
MYQDISGTIHGETISKRIKTSTVPYMEQRFLSILRHMLEFTPCGMPVETISKHIKTHFEFTPCTMPVETVSKHIKTYR